MKRSDVQKIISKILDKYDGAIFDHDIVANEILTAIEDVGMTYVEETVPYEMPLIGFGEEDEDKTPSNEIKERIVEWATAIDLVDRYFNDFNRTMIWFHTANPMLGNQIPGDMIRVGRYKKLLKFIKTSLSEGGLGK